MKNGPLQSLCIAASIVTVITLTCNWREAHAQELAPPGRPLVVPGRPEETVQPPRYADTRLVQVVIQKGEPIGLRLNYVPQDANHRFAIAGFEPGDLIVSWNGVELNSSRAIDAAIVAIGTEARFRAIVKRGGNRVDLRFSPLTRRTYEILKRKSLNLGVKVTFGVGLSFIILKFLFHLLGWYSRDSSDQLYRKQLDALFDRLWQMPPVELFQRFLGRTVTRFDDTFGAFPFVSAKWLGVFFALNVVSLPLGVVALWILREQSLLGGIVGSAESYLFQSMPQAVTALLVAGVIGALFDLVSLAVTRVLLVAAAKAEARLVGVGLLLLDAAFVFIVFLCARWLFVFGSCLIFDVHSSFEEAWMLLYPDLSGFAAPITLVATSALPTIAYLTVGVVLAGLHFFPQGMNQCLIRTVYQISTDSKPVLSQIGNVVGVGAAILTALGVVLTQ